MSQSALNRPVADKLEAEKSVLDQPFLGKLNVEKTLYVAIFALAVFLRLYELGLRPYHHDESIHAFFSWKITQSGLGDYRYDPVYHGPVLYYSSALMMALFGDSDFTGRLSAVAFGLVVLAFAWPMRRYLGRWGALWFLALVTFSPAWTYFTRFIRHDIYLAGCNLAAVVLAFRYGEERKPQLLYLSAAALALAFCTKEDNYFLVPIFLIALALSHVWELFYSKTPGAVWRRTRQEVGGFFRQAWLPLITSAVIFAIIWSIFYTSFGYHPEEWNGVTPALTYWLGQHEIKRIGGHWSYYVPQLMFYEPLILLPLVALVFSPLVNKRPASALGRAMQGLAIVSLVAFAVLLFLDERGSVGAHNAAPVALVLGFGFCLGALATTWLPDVFTRFAILNALGTVTIYGWAQEKVPWLLIPQLLPLTLVAARWWANKTEDRSLLKPSTLIPTALVGGLTLWSVIVSNFIWDAPKPEEPGARLEPPVRHENVLSYVQSTYDIHMVMDRIERLAKITGTGLKTRLACSGDATWPFSWYLRHYPVNWAANLRNIDQPVVIVDKGVQKSTDEVLLETYEKVPFQIRGWWEPRWDFGTSPTLSDVVRFLVTRVVWSPVGSSDAVMYIHKNPQPGVTDLPTLTVNPPPAARGYAQAPTFLTAAAIWGQKGSGPGEFNEPRSLAIDGAGNLLVMDTKNNRFQKFSPDGKVLGVWGSTGEGEGQFKDPHGLAIGPDGSIYVADTWNHRIQKFDPSGKFLLQFGKEEPGFWGPRGIAVSQEGNVYVTDTGNKRVVSFTADGKLLETWGGDGSAPRQFIEPVGVAVNSAGEVVVADTGNRRLQFFLSDGTFQRELPVSGWEEFYTEPYIAISGDDIFVTDSYAHHFARYRDGKVTGLWGKSGSGPGDFNRPIGIAVAGPTTVYIADTFNNRIQKFELPSSESGLVQGPG